MDDQQRQQRGERILDAAGELILRLGYDKTTVGDVARHARVAKGTIYLHWPTREALFLALLRRERLTLIEDVHAHDDPASALTLRRYVTLLARALLARPLLRAVVVRDLGVLGRLSEHAHHAPGAHHGFGEYLGELAAADLIRTDLDTAERTVVVTAIHLGTLISAPLLDDSPGDERLAELLADAVDRALDRGRPLDEHERATASRLARAHLHASLDDARAAATSQDGPR